MNSEETGKGTDDNPFKWLRRSGKGNGREKHREAAKVIRPGSNGGKTMICVKKEGKDDMGLKLKREAQATRISCGKK